jgi:hypothetical protein
MERWRGLFFEMLKLALYILPIICIWQWSL